MCSGTVCVLRYIQLKSNDPIRIVGRSPFNEQGVGIGVGH